MKWTPKVGHGGSVSLDENDSLLAVVRATARLFPARDQALVHTWLNTGWRRGPVHERSELPAIEPVPLYSAGKVAANGSIWERTAASGSKAFYTLLH
jgi:hypothetical protein